MEAILFSLTQNKKAKEKMLKTQLLIKKQKIKFNNKTTQ